MARNKYGHASRSTATTKASRRNLKRVPTKLHKKYHPDQYEKAKPDVSNSSGSDSAENADSVDQQCSTDEMIQRMRILTNKISEAVSLVFPDQYAHGLAQMVTYPAPKLRNMYVQVLLPKDQIESHRLDGTEPQWKPIARDLTSKKLLRAGYFLTSLIWHLIHSDIIEAELSMEKFRSTIDFSRAPGRFLHAALEAHGENATAIFHVAAHIQFNDREFLNDVVDPLAHELVLDLMLYLSAHFFLIDSTTSAADWHLETVRLLRQACREAIVMKEKSKALGEKLEFISPTGEEFDDIDMTAAPGHEGDLVAYTIVPKLHAGEDWLAYSSVALMDTVETMDEGSQ